MWGRPGKSTGVKLRSGGVPPSSVRPWGRLTVFYRAVIRSDLFFKQSILAAGWRITQSGRGQEVPVVAQR